MMKIDQETVRNARQYLRERERRRLAEREALRSAVLEEARDAIARRAPGFPAVRSVYLFGSVTRVGRFGRGSDVDVAVECADSAAESAFWRALEEDLGRPVDVRPFEGVIAEEARTRGEHAYTREGGP